MSGINEIGSSALADYAFKSQKNEKEELDKNAFLKLMVAQMENQDPLSPQENSEFVAQLAQFSSVEGIENMNSTMNMMANSMQSSQALQASALVGRTVHVASDRSLLADTGAVTGTINLPSGTSDLQISIANAAGELVNQVPLGSRAAGDIAFAWNGTNQAGDRLPAGEYTFRAIANSPDGSEEVPMVLSANVNSVSINPDRSVVLNLAGQGPVPLLSVAEIL